MRDGHNQRNQLAAASNSEARRELRQGARACVPYFELWHTAPLFRSHDSELACCGLEGNGHGNPGKAENAGFFVHGAPFMRPQSDLARHPHQKAQAPIGLFWNGPAP